MLRNLLIGFEVVLLTIHIIMAVYSCVVHFICKKKCNKKRNSECLNCNKDNNCIWGKLYRMIPYTNSPIEKDIVKMERLIDNLEAQSEKEAHS